MSDTASVLSVDAGAAPLISFNLTFQGNLVDAVALTVTILKPNGAETLYTYNVNPEIVRLSVGQYNFRVVTDNTEGRWYYRIRATGTYQDTKIGYFNVHRSRFTTP